MNTILDEYKHTRLSKKIKLFYTSSLIRSIGSGLIGSFGTIFFFQQFNNSLEKVIILKISLFFLFLVLTPIAMRFLKKYGIELMMRLAIPLLSISMFSLYMWNSVNMYVVVVIYVLSLSLFRSMYWVPYHVDFAKLTNKDSRGKQIAILQNISTIISMIIPLISSFIIIKLGFSTLFAIATLITLSSIIPLTSIKTTYETYTFGYLETFRNVFKKNNRPLFLSHFGNGMQSIIGSVIWPIFIFMIFDEKYSTFGIVASLSIVSMVILKFAIGYISDKFKKKDKILKTSGLLHSTGWLLKMFIDTPTEVFMVDTYHNIGKVSQDMVYSHSLYEHAADNGTFIDEYVVLRETSLNLGRIFMLLVTIPIIMFFPIKITFIFAAIATLLIKNESKEKKLL